MDKWIELDETYITNQKKPTRREPEPPPPTEAWLFCLKCRRGRGKSIIRKPFLQTIRGNGTEAIERMIAGFIERHGVIVIKSPKNPVAYRNSNAEPVAVN